VAQALPLMGLVGYSTSQRKFSALTLLVGRQEGPEAPARGAGFVSAHPGKSGWTWPALEILAVILKLPGNESIVVSAASTSLTSL